MTSKVTKHGDKDGTETWSIQYDGDIEGILNGGHTYRVIQNIIQEGETIDPEQFVRIEVLTGVPHELNIEIAEGLNTALKVEPKDFSNARGSYDEIEKVLKNVQIKMLFTMKLWF